jgi:autotransporter-associated beta strand protein
MPTLRALAALLLLAAPAAAQFTWSGGGADANWSTAANWAGGTVPPSAAATALVFTGTVNTSPAVDAGVANPFLLNGLTFDTKAGSFTITGQTHPLEFQANGATLPTITVQNTALQTINTPIVIDSSFTATAANAGNPLTGSLTLGGAISGGGSLTVTGFLSLNLGSPNTYSGGTVLNSAPSLTGAEAVLRAAATDALPNGKDVAVKSGLLRIDRFVQTIGNLSLSDPNNTFSQLPATVQLLNGGTLRLGGSLTYIRPPNVPFSIAVPATIVADAGSLDLGGTTHTFSVGGGNPGGFDLLINAPVTDVGGGTTSLGGGINLSGGGVMRLNLPSSYTGPTTVSGAGTALLLGAVNALSPTTAVALQNNAVLSFDVNGPNPPTPNPPQRAGSLAGDMTATVIVAGTTFTVGSNNASTEYDGAIKDGPNATGGQLIKVGTGVLTLGGSSQFGIVSTYSGGTVIQGGTLRMAAGANNVLPGGGPVILSGGTLDLNGTLQQIGSLSGAAGSLTLTGTLAIGGAANTTFGGTITGNGTLVKSGTGILDLTGTNPFSGSASVTGGILRVNGSLPNAHVSVLSGAKLGGAGTIGNGTVTPGNPFISVQSGGSVAPGNSPGILTVAGSVAFSGGSSFEVELNGPTPGNGANFHDQLMVTGAGNTIALNGATLSATLGYTPAANDKLFILDNETGTAIQGTFAQGSSITIGGYAAQISYLGNPVAMTTTGGNSVVLFGFTPVPEPASALLACAAAAGVAWARRGRRG